jgi:hypothetical protein
LVTDELTDAAASFTGSAASTGCSQESHRIIDVQPVEHELGFAQLTTLLEIAAQ